MKGLRRFAALPAPERRLVLTALLFLGAVRVGLWVLPFATMSRGVRALGRAPRHPGRGAPDDARIAWAIGAADRLVPRSTCLVRALAAQGLFARHGHPSEVRLGVTGGGGRPFEAHAWLERDGRVVIGAQALSRYVPLPPIEART